MDNRKFNDEELNKPLKNKGSDDVPFFANIADLMRYIGSQCKVNDYEDVPQALSNIAVASFEYAAYTMDVSGAQASFAHLIMLKKLRRMEDGFSVLDYNDLLYPQMLFKIPTVEALLEDNKEHLAKKAKQMLNEAPDAHPAVITHWKRLVANGTEEKGNAEY